MSLYQDWIDAKDAEKAAIDKRRRVEDELVKQFQINECLDGTENREADGYKIKIVGRLNKKVNADLLQEVAAENGLSDYLPTLFRWKPDIIAAAWRAASKEVTDVLSQAIITEPGRPTFTIEKTEVENG